MKYIILLLLIVLTMPAHSQSIAVSAEKMNVMYIGVPNPITAIVENVPCKDIVVETSSGKITKSEQACQYEVWPTAVGKILINIYRKQDKKLLGQKEFRIKRIPTPIAAVGGRSSGGIKRAVLQVQLGVTLYMEGFDFDAQFSVKSYKVSIIRNNSLIFEGQCMGARFNNEVFRAFSTLKAGDIFECTDIKFSGMGYDNGLADPITLTVTD